MIKIKLIKDTEKFKVGQIIQTSKKSAENYISQGFAELVEEPKKEVKKVNAKEKPKAETKEELYDVIAEDFISEESKEVFNDIYKRVIEILKYYCDLKEEDYSIIALWIIGTYLYKNFQTYPYLFFNAPKGSGKTRLLKLIAKLSYNGEIIVSISESVLFRISGDSTICIDEFESLHGKEKQALRELLNAGYKKGLGVKRAVKVKGAIEKFAIESFDVFAPKAMANIWGMDEVLGDRAITIILDKSNNPAFTQKIENFDYDIKIVALKNMLSSNRVFCSLCSLCSKCSLGGYNTLYQNYNDNITTYYTNYTKYTNCTNYIPTTNSMSGYDILFKKIIENELEGRNLELFFPLLVIALSISDELVDLIIGIAKENVILRREEDSTENRDVLLLGLISEMNSSGDFVKVREITNKLKEFDDSDFINTRWVGRALKRLNLIIEKRRREKGIEVMLNYTKAKEKMKMFKDKEEDKKDGNEEIQQNITVTEEKVE